MALPPYRIILIIIPSYPQKGVIGPMADQLWALYIIPTRFWCVVFSDDNSRYVLLEASFLLSELILQMQSSIGDPQLTRFPILHNPHEGVRDVLGVRTLDLCLSEI